MMESLSGLILPISYVGVLFSILYFAGKSLKGREKALIQEASPYFPIHRQKLEYEELSEQYYTDDPTGARVLQVALMKRAMESIRRAMRLQQEKPPLQQMVREGVIGESLWEKLLLAEQEIELEMKDLMEEANIYKPNWGTTFLQEASGLVQQSMQAFAKAQQMAEQQEVREKTPIASSPPTTDAVEDGGDDENIPTLEAAAAVAPAPKPKKPSSPLTDADRERLARELIEEEEREKQRNSTRQRKNSKGGSGKK